MSFLMACPEVNSAQMYSGAGSGPMIAAAVAWGGLADELNSAATAFWSMISELATSSWQGPAAMAMTTAAAPYAHWLGGAATHAGGAATGAKEVAVVYETAKAGVVHPVSIASNRRQTVALAMHNFFGLNAPAIAAKEFEYEAMWAKDVDAMVGYYSGASAVADQLVPWETALKGLPGTVVAAAGAAAPLSAAAVAPGANPAATAVEYGLIAALISVTTIAGNPVLIGTIDRTFTAVSTTLAPVTKAVSAAVAPVAAAVAPVARAIAETPVVAAATAALAPVTKQVAAVVNDLTNAATATLLPQLVALSGDPALLTQFVTGAVANPELLNNLVPVLTSNPALVNTVFGVLAGNPALVTSLIAQVQSNPALAAQLLAVFTQLQASNPALAAQLAALAEQLGRQLGIIPAAAPPPSGPVEFLP